MEPLKPIHSDSDPSPPPYPSAFEAKLDQKSTLIRLQMNYWAPREAKTVNTAVTRSKERGCCLFFFSPTCGRRSVFLPTWESWGSDVSQTHQENERATAQVEEKKKRSKRRSLASYKTLSVINNAPTFTLYTQHCIVSLLHIRATPIWFEWQVQLHSPGWK